MFTHVTREEGEERLHISHLHHYVSAYTTDNQTVTDLIGALEAALKLSETTGTTQIVDQDGEFFFVVHPRGLICLCVPWKFYRVLREEGNADA